jgi:hypothetical protein
MVSFGKFEDSMYKLQHNNNDHKELEFGFITKQIMQTCICKCILQTSKTN